MILVAVSALGISAAQANPPAGSGSGPTVVVTGHTSRTPDGKVKVDATVNVDDEDVSERYGPIWPTKAYDVGVSGRVVLACKMTAQGFAQACSIASETPQKMGFGEAALQLQPSLRVPPPSPLPASGAVMMNIAVRFDAPENTLDGQGALPDTVGAVTAGRGVSPRSGRPIIMQSVTMLQHPIWSAAPSFDNVRQVYPAHANSAEGFVVLRCDVERTGALRGCDVSKEEPERQGFDRAALKLAPLFRVSPAVMAKAPRTGEIQVFVPIRFALAGAGVEPTVSAPSWISGLDPQTAPKLFPPQAAARGLTTGRGVARCVVGADGALTQCRPEGADPDGIGFSEAAVVVAAAMKMNLWSADAGPVSGGVVRVPVRLNLAQPQ